MLLEARRGHEMFSNWLVNKKKEFFGIYISLFGFYKNIPALITLAAFDKNEIIKLHIIYNPFPLFKMDIILYKYVYIWGTLSRNKSVNKILFSIRNSLIIGKTMLLGLLNILEYIRTEE